MLRFIIQLFPLWAILLSAFAFYTPEPFVALKASIIPLLAFIMLTMGLTLTPADFRHVLNQPKAVLIGLVLQFSVMPLVALLIALLFQFDADLTLGMVLVGCVAGGTASNVMCFLAKGDVALSISMTAMSTLAGVVLTPLLVELLAGQVVDIPLAGMMLNLLKIVLFPVLTGVLLNYFFSAYIQRLVPLLPLFSVAAIVLIIAIVVALNAATLPTIGPIVALAVVLHNTTGLSLGYLVAKRLGLPETSCRTIALEVGLQNSGLAVALAMKFFAPASALAGTLFSIWHNVSGSVLATWWRKRSRSLSSQSVEQSAEVSDA
ncbi:MULTISPECIES: bile acid:sodium symporter family protein [Pseudoalteromonas]|uniref:bile acid:sodium symporter family protein n=1 Tax=Pseudoalteromonas TaxID=53246 RepID=UPI000F7B344C|nr:MULTISPECIES: bile acid:sodium symporter family protein [Pseudoalteromonas]MEC4087806.1 bile acid:sodium symporter family protein [Pseudoalteromonas rubra]